MCDAARDTACLTGRRHSGKAARPLSTNARSRDIRKLGGRIGASLYMLRDLHDRTRIAVVLIGMPGLDQRFPHYPQLFSRLGFAHNYQPLTTEGLMFVLDRQWKRVGHELDPDDVIEAAASTLVVG